LIGLTRMRDLGLFDQRWIAPARERRVRAMSYAVKLPA
jgi:hypothetical protein